jgi:formamidopyrimidine-DNA glycosylase
MKLEHCEALREGIVAALELALEKRGSSIDDYRDLNGEPGSMQEEFLVHTREGEACVRCGETIRRVVVSGRSTYFCPGCQVRLRARPRRRRRAAASG